MKTYMTTDYQLATVLTSLGFVLSRVDKTDPRRSVFHFEHHDDIPSQVDAFFRGELLLDPRIVLTNARLVKDRLHAGR